jgi:menaquinone-dependent protoporphyrinogen oxidase
MKRLLIAYVSHSGSTQEIANFLCDELTHQGHLVDVRSISEISNLSSYDGIVAGGLLYRFGWHPEIIQFLKKNLPELREKKVALFVTGMRLGQVPQSNRFSYPVFVDPSILKCPSAQHRGTPLDAITTIDNYLRAALPTLAILKPVSLGIFAGKLDLHTLKLPEQLIMLMLMLLSGLKAGDHRNWEFIRTWIKNSAISLSVTCGDLPPQHPNQEDSK